MLDPSRHKEYLAKASDGHWSDPAAKKRGNIMTRLTISVAAGPRIDITSPQNTKGGNMRARSGRRIVWMAGPSVQTFDLKFDRLEEGDGAVGTSDDWPFLAVRSVPPGAVNEDDCSITGATKVIARLAPDYGVFKYTVKVTPAAGPPPPDLDPIIIVDR